MANIDVGRKVSLPKAFSISFLPQSLQPSSYPFSPCPHLLQPNPVSQSSGPSLFGSFTFHCQVVAEIFSCWRRKREEKNIFIKVGLLHFRYKAISFLILPHISILFALYCTKEYLSPFWIKFATALILALNRSQSSHETCGGEMRRGESEIHTATQQLQSTNYV